MKALSNLQQALQAAHGRRKAFKMQPITLSDRQRGILKDYKKGYNWQALTDIQAFQIVRGRNTQIDAIKVVWVLYKKHGMMHYFTTNEFNKLLNN